MRILTLEQFCQEPANTLFSLFQSGGEILGKAELSIKADRYKNEDGEFTFSSEKIIAPNFIDWRAKISTGVEYDTHTFCPNTSECDFEAEDLFLVYNKDEIIDMMRLLEDCLTVDRGGLPWEASFHPSLLYGNY